LAAAGAAAGIAGLKNRLDDLDLRDGAQQRIACAAEIGQPDMRMDDHTAGNGRHELLPERIQPADQIFGDVVEIVAGLAMALEGLAKVQLTGGTPVQNLFGAKSLEAVDRIGGDARAGSD